MLMLTLYLSLISTEAERSRFEEVYSQCRKQMIVIATSILKNEDDASDAVSNAVLKAYTKINQLKKYEFFKTWVTKILKNECYEIIRKNSKI